MADFGKQLLAFADKTGEALEDVDRGFKIGLFNRAVLNTRVHTGRLRGNWQVSNGVPASGETGRFQKIGGLDPSEAAKILPFSVTYLTNNVPYALVWEVRDGITGRAILESTTALTEALANAKN